MLTYGNWQITQVYEDRKMSVSPMEKALDISLADHRYSAVKAILPVAGIQERWYYRMHIQVQNEGLDHRMFIIWLDKDGTELVKEHIRDQSRALAPQGAVRAELEAFVYGCGHGRSLVSDIGMEADVPYSERNVRVCAVASNMSDPECTEMPFADTVDYHLEQIDKIAHLKPDVIVLTENVFQTLEKTRPTTPVCLDGEEVTRLREKAKRYNTYIVCSLTEKDGDGVLHNTGLLIDRQGEIQDSYHKTHLSIGELERGIPPYDEKIAVFDTDFGRIGILICWEHYFPEMARLLTLKGAEMLLIPTHGFDLSRAVSRAMDNGVYLVTAHVRGGDTVIVAPNGDLVDTGEQKGYAFAEIDLNEPRHIFWLSYPANMIPNNVYMNERREELYGAISGSENAAR